MKFRVTGLIIVLLAALITACQSENELEFKRYYTGGMLIYQTKCQNCHGANGEGLSALIPPLTDTAYLKKNQNKLACLVKYGINETIITVKGRAYEGTMPANTDMASVDVAKVLTYIGNSFGNKLGVIAVDDTDGNLAKCK